MNISRYEILKTVIEKGSFSAASEELGYTPSGLNRLINTIENDFGIEIFKRTKKGLSLTYAGKEILPIIEKICNNEKSLRTKIDEINGFDIGEINIGTIYSVASLWIPFLYKKFNERYPGIKVNTIRGTHDALNNYLEEEKVDLIFTTFQVNDSRENWFPIRKDKLVIWVNKDSPYASLKKFPQEMLKDVPQILFTPALGTEIERFLKKNNLFDKVRYSSNDLYSIYKCVEAGLGVSLNIELMNRAWTDDVVAIPLDPPIDIELGLRIPSNGIVSSVAKKFISLSEDEEVQRFCESV